MAVKEKADAGTPESFDTAKAFIAEHGKVNESGSAVTMVRGNYYDFMEQNNIPRTVVDSLHSAERQLVGGMIEHATDLLQARVVEAKKNGDDVSGMQQQISCLTANGKISTTVHNMTTPTNPASGEKMEKFGTVRVAIKASGVIPKDSATRAQDLMRAANGK